MSSRRVSRSIIYSANFKAMNGLLAYLTENCWTVRGYSGCYDVTMIARGKADLWLSGSGMPWDYAPAVVIARECGARFITRLGDDRIDAMHCLICTPGLETELRRILEIGPS